MEGLTRYIWPFITWVLQQLFGHQNLIVGDGDLPPTEARPIEGGGEEKKYEEEEEEDEVMVRSLPGCNRTPTTGKTSRYHIFDKENKN